MTKYIQLKTKRDSMSIQFLIFFYIYTHFKYVASEVRLENIKYLKLYMSEVQATKINFSHFCLSVRPV